MKNLWITTLCLSFLFWIPLAKDNSPRPDFVYSPGVFSLDVIYQPVGNHLYVSEAPDAVTLFQLPFYGYENIGLLAHNYLAGESFFELEEGHLIFVLFEDGSVQEYEVTEIVDYQALNGFFSFKSLEDGQVYSDRKVFNRVYTRKNTVTLQTCIERNGDLTWGLRFVIAEPVDFRGEQGESDEIYCGFSKTRSSAVPACVK